MEEFARILWGLAHFWNGEGNTEEFQKIYLRGAANGTNPLHEEYWEKIGDDDQCIVETVAMGLVLILVPDKIWEPLCEEEKDNFYNWLNLVNKVKPSDNNWNLYPVLINIGFKTIGIPYNITVVNRCLARIEDFYNKNGWYTDGNTSQIDYYIAFAIYFYSLIYAKVMENGDPERSTIMKKRAIEFAKDFCKINNILMYEI